MMSFCHFHKKIELDIGCGPCWPSFYPSRILKEQFLKVLPNFLFLFSELHYIVTYKFLTKKSWVKLKGKIWPNSTTKWTWVKLYGPTYHCDWFFLKEKVLSLRRLLCNIQIIYHYPQNEYVFGIVRAIHHWLQDAWGRIICYLSSDACSKRCNFTRIQKDDTNEYIIDVICIWYHLR